MSDQHDAHVFAWACQRGLSAYLYQRLLSEYSDLRLKVDETPRLEADVFRWTKEWEREQNLGGHDG